MVMTCVAILDNDIQIDNLAQCIKILGGEPEITKNMVRVSAPHPSELSSHLLTLYEHYWQREITITEN